MRKRLKRWFICMAEIHFIQHGDIIEIIWCLLSHTKTIISKKNIFLKTSNLLVWQGSQYTSELASKVKDISFLNQFKYQVTDNLLLGKTKRKSPRNFKIVEQKYCWKERIHRFSNLTLLIQTLANIIGTFNSGVHG